jgi:hypothetical protein
MRGDMNDVARSLNGTNDGLSEVITIESQFEIGTDAERPQNMLDDYPVCSFKEMVLRIVGVDHIDLFQTLLANRWWPHMSRS